MKNHSMTALILFLLQILCLAGCGSNGGTTTGAVSTLAASQKCIMCHGGSDPSVPTVSPVTGARYSDEWIQSAHNTESSANKSGNGTSCSGCHGSAHNHPNDYCGQCHGGSGAPAVTWLNPDATGQCWNCHRADLPKSSPAHFYNITGAGVHPAMYVTARRQSACSSCHNPHLPDPTQEMKDWAGSPHGDVKGAGWSNRDFKNTSSNGTYNCIRCHTATGYKNFLAGNWSNPFPTTTWATPADGNGREVLTCDACHASYDFRNSFRRPPAFTAPYNKGQNPAAFPDAGASNLCIACHSGRESGNTINAITDFTNASLPSPHHAPAAGLMYMTTGFTGFTSANTVIGTSTYGKSLTPDTTVPGGITGGVGSTHRKLGTELIRGDSHNPTVFTAGNFDADGPCVTCHMNATGRPNRVTSHTWQINGNAFDQVCTNCHPSENTVPLTSANFLTAFVEPQSEAFETCLTLLENTLLAQWNIQFKNGSFYDLTKDPTGATRVTDWTRQQAGAKAPAGVTLPLTTPQAKKLMGACFNISLLYNDPAAFAHARTFSRRLVYDSIDYLDDGKLNLSAGATALASGQKLADGVTNAFGKDTKAYNTSGKTITTIYGSTSEAMLYLIAWSRQTGAWNSPERP